MGKDHFIRTTIERRFSESAARLVRSDFEWLGRAMLKVVRLMWRNRPVREHAESDDKPQPTGPYLTTRMHHLGDLLIWVPRRIDSYLIDDLTGGYGYSHVSVDTGEVDLPTGQPVHAEVTVGQAVKRAFQNEFGQRAYVRVPISKTGVNPRQFVECVKSKLGDPYDSWDALTLGEVQDPAKEVCSGLAADCLPDNVRADIGKARRLGLLRRSSVSVHSRPGAAKTKEFVSPNGFAQYYGAPQGEALDRPDILVEPHPVDTSTAGVIRHHGWKAGLILAALAGIFVILRYGRKPIARVLAG